MSEPRSHTVVNTLVRERPNGISIGPRYYKREKAVRLLVAIDDILHPWDKPGLVPTEPGPYFTTDGRVVESCTRTDRGWLWHRDGQRDPELMFDQVLDLAQQQGWQFRKRWTPSPREAHEQCPNSGSPISRGGEWQCSCGARGVVPADMCVPAHPPGRAP